MFPAKRHEADCMKKLLKSVVFGALATLTVAAPALAHPHVWVTMKSEVVYAADGSVTGVRHAWTFDEMFSTFAVQGIETKKKGVFTREELKPLAEVNVTSLKDFEYFNYAKLNGKKAAFVDPTDYWLDYKDSALTLNFLLPLQSPQKAQNFELEIYDPSYFVDFTFAEKDPVALVSTPAQVALAGTAAQCKLAVGRPNDATPAQSQRLGESFFSQLGQGSTFGAQFANRITVKCP
jgi:ABC-type uncharacterized transport system substrate-binding protein